jgi:hypothetical protein
VSEFPRYATLRRAVREAFYQARTARANSARENLRLERVMVSPRKEMGR